MKLSDLKQKGGVITDALVKKPIEWTRPDPNQPKPPKGKPLESVKPKLITDKFDIYVRRHAFGVMESMFVGGEGEKYRNARYLSASVLLGENGDEELPYEDAVNLDPGLGVLLLQAVNEVNAPAKS